MKILNRIITFVTTVFVIIACIVFAATAICKIGNIEPRIVLSGSMEPKIHTGSICFINKKVPYDKIKTGDIIAFKAGKNTMVTHRVISVTNAGFETKGDANKVSDGISTNKTHARGPVGLEGLTIYKYKLHGNGQIVDEYVKGKKHFHHKDLA